MWKVFVDGESEWVEESGFGVAIVRVEKGVRMRKRNKTPCRTRGLVESHKSEAFQ